MFFYLKGEARFKKTILGVRRLVNGCLLLRKLLFVLAYEKNTSSFSLIFVENSLLRVPKPRHFCGGEKKRKVTFSSTEANENSLKA